MVLGYQDEWCSDIRTTVAINRFNAISEKQYGHGGYVNERAVRRSIASDTVLRAFMNYNWTVINDIVVIDR